MGYKDYSVLMSVYYKEKAEYLRMAMESMFTQTVPTNDFVLVCDGPLTDELDKVISEMQEEYRDVLHVIRLEKNVGLGKALQQGVMSCRNEYIARMDSDDISCKDRCEKELKIFAKSPDISIVGSFIEEFGKIPGDMQSIRVVPEQHEDIVSFSKNRNPFNHPSVMFKKIDILAAGNYSDVRYLQDYYLWISMLIKGFKGYNIQEPLVWMRADQNLFKRRSGRQYLQIQLNLFKYMKEQHYISVFQYVKSAFARSCSAYAPNRMRQFVFERLLRKG